MADTDITGFETLSDLTDFLHSYEGSIKFIAGGTDLISAMNGGGVECDLIVDLSQTTDLSFIKDTGPSIDIGAATTFSQIAENPLIQEKATCLAQAAAQIGSVQIRNRATIGGNIATASPAADSLPPLTVLRAESHVMTIEKMQVPTIEQRSVDVCGASLARNELITKVSIPIPKTGYRSGFVKLGARSAVSIAKLNIAAIVKFNSDTSMIEEGSIALGALGEEPICPDDLRDFLAGRSVDSNLAPDLFLQLSNLVKGAIPDRISAPYKMSASKALAYDLVQILFGDILESVAKESYGF